MEWGRPGTGSRMTDVYRAPMRSHLDTVPDFAGVRRGLELGVCGIGGRLAEAPADLAEALARTEEAYGERAAARLRRWHDVPVGSTVWTRDKLGGLHRGELTGPWAYDASPAAFAVDLVHVRPCAWRQVAPPEVPDAVLETFDRGGRNFQRITRLSEFR